MPVYLTLCCCPGEEKLTIPKKKSIAQGGVVFFYWNKSERHGSEEMNEPTESNFSGRLNERPGAQQVLTRPFSGWGPLLGRPRLPSLSNIFAFFFLFFSSMCLLVFSRPYVLVGGLFVVCNGRLGHSGADQSRSRWLTHTHKMGGPVEERWICAVVALARYHPAHQPVLKKSNFNFCSVRLSLSQPKWIRCFRRKGEKQN